MIRYLYLCILALGFVSNTQAHPHSHVEQQALLSIGLYKLVLNIRIVPSYVEGAEIYAHIDTDMNGIVSDREASDFGRSILDDVTMLVDGDQVSFFTPVVSIPDLQSINSGFGMIELETSVDIQLTDQRQHKLSFAIGYQEFANDWFIQPFYFPDLNETIPDKRLERSHTDHSVMLTLTPSN